MEQSESHSRGDFCSHHTIWLPHTSCQHPKYEHTTRFLAMFRCDVWYGYVPSAIASYIADLLMFQRAWTALPSLV